MEISNNSNYLWAASSMLYSPSTTDFTSAISTTDFSSLLSVDSTSDIFSEIMSSMIEELGSLGSIAGQDGPPPPTDVDSMSMDEFVEHLVEVQEQLQAQGVDISDLNDPTEMSLEELEALQEELASGQTPPPPPPMHLNIVDFSSLSLDALTTLFDYM